MSIWWPNHSSYKMWVRSNAGIVCDLSHRPEREKGQVWAECVLISAAPDLLEAAKLVVGDLEAYCKVQVFGPGKRLQQLKDAIKKAEDLTSRSRCKNGQEDLNGRR
jgi:hypothetical protein